MTNAALVAKLEQAQEGSRELSDEVLVALRQLSESYKLMPDCPAPTRDLQDAVDLVPEGLYWSIGWHTSNGNLLAKTVLWPPGPWPGPNEGWRGQHQELAISFSIALLKAVEARDG